MLGQEVAGAPCPGGFSVGGGGWEEPADWESPGGGPQGTKHLERGGQMPDLDYGVGR